MPFREPSWLQDCVKTFEEDRFLAMRYLLTYYVKSCLLDFKFSECRKLDDKLVSRLKESGLATTRDIHLMENTDIQLSLLCEKLKIKYHIAVSFYMKLNDEELALRKEIVTKDYIWEKVEELMALIENDESGPILCLPKPERFSEMYSPCSQWKQNSSH